MKTFTTVLAAAAATLLVGCGSAAEPTPVPTTTVATARTTTPVKGATGAESFTAAEKAYLRGIDAARVPYINKADIVAVGRDVCAMLKTEPDPVNVATALARQSRGLFTAKETSTIVGTTIGSGLCD